MNYYPIYLDMEGRNVLVVGGGYVALQKIKGLLESGANVKVVAKQLIAQEIKELNIDLEIRDYIEEDLLNISIVVAATNSNEVNRMIKNHSKKHNVLVNAVDDKENCDFILGAVLRKGDITITVSTAGKSPIVAKKIRDKVGNMMSIDYEKLLSVYAYFRDKAYKELNDKGRKEFFEFLEAKFDEILFNNKLVEEKFNEVKIMCV